MDFEFQRANRLKKDSTYVSICEKLARNFFFFMVKYFFNDSYFSDYFPFPISSLTNIDGWLDGMRDNYRKPCGLAGSWKFGWLEGVGVNI